ncbi:MFS transporter [Natribacillus halophilus]|uniref:Major Facilitator Superfamily protein n=1 Tax=Natribacillus halophilus TaxID=549003 RepID=A0A1G8PHB8_9BACI|nr:MFS transporter [Natribacillus halophilus]SDI91904.1 Major Facilitator Superfamily protein [Natribacillus halophilus]
MYESKPLLRNRIFILLLIAGIFAVVGFSMFLTTVSWYAISEMDSAAAVGLVLMAATIPRLVMMMFGGVVADKYKKTTIMFTTNLVQACLLFSMYLFVANDHLTLFVLLVLAGIFGMLDAFFGPASVSLIPKVVPKRQLQRANAIFQGADQISFIIGPILAGLTMESLGVPASFLTATILVFLSAFFIFPPFLKEAPVEERVPQSPWQDLKEGMGYVRRSNFLLTGLIVLIALNFFVFGALHVAIPLLVDVHEGTPMNLSYMEASLGIGMLLGSFLLSVYTIRKRRGAVTIYGLLASLLLFIIFSLVPSLSWLTALLFFIGFAMVFVYIPFFTVAQEKTENRIMGRVMSIIFLAMNGFDPIAYGIVAGFVAAGIPVQIVLFGLGMAGLLLAFFIFFKAKAFRDV